MLKRLFDVVFASGALLFLSPILLLVVVLVRINFGSPIFFHQTRPGLNGHPFNIVKFRTMLEAVDANGKPLKRPAHISEKEWAKMNREEQMERMNKLAAGFNFYAMDNKNENLKYKMPDFKK